MSNDNGKPHRRYYATIEVDGDSVGDFVYALIACLNDVLDEVKTSPPPASKKDFADSPFGHGVVVTVSEHAHYYIDSHDVGPQHTAEAYKKQVEEYDKARRERIEKRARELGIGGR